MLTNIKEICKNQKFITEISQFANSDGTVIRISTLFEHSDGGLLDIFVFDTHLTDYGETCSLFINSNGKLNHFLKDENIIFIFDSYGISRKGGQFIKSITSDILNDIFRFGQFCSILSHLMLKEKLHVPD